jgi:hypothetical protein
VVADCADVLRVWARLGATLRDAEFSKLNELVQRSDEHLVARVDQFEWN